MIYRLRSFVCVPDGLEHHSITGQCWLKCTVSKARALTISTVRAAENSNQQDMLFEYARQRIIVVKPSDLPEVHQVSVRLVQSITFGQDRIDTAKHDGHFA